MKKIKKLALFCMALAGAITFSVGCNFDININIGGNSSSSSKYEDPSSSDKESANNTSSSSKNENSSISKDENSSTSKEENSSTAKDENSSSISKDEQSSSTSKDENSSTSKDENSSSTSKDENSSTSKDEDSSSSSSTDENSSSTSKDEDSSSSSSSGDQDSSNSSSSDSSSTNDPDYPDTYPENGDCVFGDWELVTEADCERKGTKVRYCTIHGEIHADYETFAARGHDYGTTGICSICEEEALLPDIDKNATYINPADKNSGIIGSGHDYPQYRPISEDEVEKIPNSGRYQFSVGGYYEVELGNEGTCWFVFSVPEAGQYAVISTSNPNDVALTQYAAANEEAMPFSIGEARVLENGNFVSIANCSNLHFNEEWRATFCLTGSAGDTVKFYIVKVGNPAWQPEYVTVNMEATQLNGKAPEGAEGTTATEVPYESSYFYDETSGYYRMGTESNPGEILYVAITKNATRLMGEMSFVGLQEEGASLIIGVGTTVEGDYLMYDYAPMIYSDSNYNGTENSYQAFLNSDGMYPVTKELQEFLALYVSKKTSLNVDGEAWLAACYYYKNLTPGSAEYPIKLNTLGDFTAQQTSAYSAIYYTFTYNPNPEATGTVSTYCTITVNTDNVALSIGGKTYYNQNGVKGIQNIPFEANSVTGVTFNLRNINPIAYPNNTSFEVSIKLLEGSSEAPIELATLGEVALTPIQILMISGEYNYEAYYSYKATESGTLTLATASTAQIMLGENVNVVDGSASIQVAADETVTIYVNATSADAVNVNLAFAPTV